MLEIVRSDIETTNGISRKRTAIFDSYGEYASFKDENFTLSLELTFMRNGEYIQQPTEYLVRSSYNYLLAGEVIEFRMGDKILIGMFTDIQQRATNKYYVFNCTFTTVEPYINIPQTKKLTVFGDFPKTEEMEIALYNISSKLYPTIKVYCSNEDKTVTAEENGTLEIRNISTGRSIKVDLVDKETITINTENMEVSSNKRTFEEIKFDINDFYVADNRNKVVFNSTCNVVISWELVSRVNNLEMLKFNN